MIAAYIFTLLSLKILYDDGVYVAKIVDKYLSKFHISHYTVMITDIPPQYQNQSNLYHLLQTIYPDKIEKVHVVKNSNFITKLSHELHVYRQKFKKAVEFNKKHDKRLQVIVSYFPRPRYADGINYYNQKINELKSELDYLLSTPKYAPTAFIHFNNLVTTSCCVSTQIFPDTLHFKCALAPYPKDVITNNLCFNSYQGFFYQCIIDIIILLMVFFWIFLINSSVMLSHIDTIFKYITKLSLHKYLSDSLIGLISGIIPTILIKAWLSLLPIMLESVYLKLSVCKDSSRLNLQVLNKYYLCLIVMVLLSLVVTQTLSRNVFYIVNAVQNIFATLAESLSKTETFFIQYIMITAFILDPINLFYPIGFKFMDIALLYCMPNKSSNDENEESKLREFDFVHFYANLSLELVVTVTYSVSNPIILFFSFIHFIMSGLIYKHLLITYFKSTCSIGRFVWIDLLQNIIYGLYLPIMTLIGSVILRHAYYQAILLIILLLFIIQIHNIIQINTKVSSSFKCVSLQTASKIDTENQFKTLFKSEAISDNTLAESNSDDNDEMTFERCYVSSYSKRLP